MKYLYLVVVVCFLLTAVEVKAEEGEELFKSLRCGICHKPDTGKSIPSLKEIARSYTGKENRLSSYLNGEAEALINPEKGGMMKRYIEKTKALSGDERKSLADFILGHKD
jgi:cytochrome c